MVSYTLRQLAFMTETARQGGIAQAARSLNMSAPAVASALDKLEATTGLTLFDRFPAHGMRLTRAGEEFSARAEALLAQAEALDRLAGDLAGGRAGTIRIGTHYALAQRIVLPAVVAHRARRPGVRIEVKESDIPTLTEDLDARKTDALLVYDQRFDLERHVVETLAELRPLVLLPATHPLAAKAELSLADLRGIPYLALTGSGPGRSYLRLMEAAGLEPDVPLSSPSHELIQAYVGKGFGFTLAGFPPRHGVSIEGDPVAAVPLTEDIGMLKVVLAHPRDAKPAPQLVEFMEACKTEAARFDSR